MKLAVVKEQQPDETRVALIPAVVKRLVGDGQEVQVESGAGARSHHDDASYEAAGAAIVNSEGGDAWLGGADVVVTVDAPPPQRIRSMRAGAALLGQLAPLANANVVAALVEQKVTSYSMEFIPRITRAQAMDVLSSQANIAGYKAVLLAADSGAKVYPMMMTAAGTIAPSRVFVIGAGVAGLQAIATARRLGAVVEAFDVRPVVKEQVQSLGARFVELELATADVQTDGGYARELTDEQRQRQTELMASHVIGADAVITTAAVFGKAPPLLITKDVVDRMRAGAVIVDLAADAAAGRGNCAATKPGERTVTARGVTIIGYTNLAALVPAHASQAYANNMHSLLRHLVRDGAVKVDLDEEIQKGAAITHDGRIVNAMVAEAQGH